MEKYEFIENIKTQFNEAILEATVIKDKRILVHIHSSYLLKIGGYLHKELGFRFIIASAYHSKDGFEILYHFSDDASGNIINIHVILPHEKPEIESLAQIFTGANWIEREMHELYGIVFLNHPNPDKLISEGNWAEGVYPYRKNFNK